MDNARRALVLVVMTLCAAAAMAAEQPYPNKPMRMVTAQVGGSKDFGLMAADLTQSLGQQIVVENRTGGTMGRCSAGFRAMVKCEVQKIGHQAGRHQGRGITA